MISPHKQTHDDVPLIVLRTVLWCSVQSLRTRNDLGQVYTHMAFYKAAVQKWISNKKRPTSPVLLKDDSIIDKPIKDFLCSGPTSKFWGHEVHWCLLWNCIFFILNSKFKPKNSRVIIIEICCKLFIQIIFLCDCKLS